jgi:hypothetical protein
MRWLKRRLRNWINDDDHCISIALDDYPKVRAIDEPDTECIRFKVFRANGGTVIQTDQYDRKTDRQHNSLHVIVDGQDIGKELGKIITFESLKL